LSSGWNSIRTGRVGAGRNFGPGVADIDADAPVSHGRGNALQFGACRRRVNSLQIGRLKIDHFDAL
jgi:hypothetical protein